MVPELVVFNQDGTPETVRYHFVNAMLLSEVQRQRQRIDEQQKANQEKAPRLLSNRRDSRPGRAHGQARDDVGGDAISGAVLGRYEFLPGAH